MAETDQTLGMYLHLVRASRMRGQALVRDKLLVLAGVQAHEMGLEPIADLCRHKILAHNPHHLVRRWPTFSEALNDDEFQLYFKQLRRRYSREKLEHMLHMLRIEMGRERQAYDSDLEYAASLLGATPESIDAILATDPVESQPAPTVFAPATSAPAWTEESVVGRLFFWGALIFGLVTALVLLMGKSLTRQW